MEHTPDSARKKVAIVTNNVNCERHIQYFSNIEKYFKTNGWEVSEDFHVDKVIICCCGFHDVMHEKVLRTVERLKKDHFLESNVIIMGCQSKTHEPELQEKLAVRLVSFGREHLLDEIINAAVPFKDILPNNIFRPYKGCDIDEADEYFHIKISQGCLRRCTFCVINKAKGYIKSEPKEEIIRQYRKALERGNHKIYLMGEDTLAYGIDTGSDIVRLVEELITIDDDVEINFGSLHIQWLEKYWQGILALCKKGIVKELHVGLQHINDQVLKRMGRPIVFKDIYEIIKLFKKECPDLFLEADILVGFPGETEEMFRELLDFFEQDRCIDNVRHFGFSDVKGAPSYGFKDKLSPNEIVVRWERFDKVLSDRSSNFKSREASTSDVAFQLTHENDYIFCKDTFKDRLEHEPVESKVLKARSNILQSESKDFGF